MQDVYEIVLGRLGSRLSFNPRPNEKELYFSPMGRFADRREDFALGLISQGKTRCLPLTKDYPIFENIEQKIEMTTLKYLCQSYDFPAEAEFTITAPFYPQDEKISSAPFFYVDAKVINYKNEEPYQATVFLSLRKNGPLNPAMGRLEHQRVKDFRGKRPNEIRPDKISRLESEHYTGFQMDAVFKGVGSQGSKNEPNPRFSTKDFNCQWSLVVLKEGLHHLPELLQPYQFRWGKLPRYKHNDQPVALPITVQEDAERIEFRIPVTVKPYEQTTVRFILAAHVDVPVMKIDEDLCPFRYRRHFPDLKSVLDFSTAERTDILDKVAFFNNTFRDSLVAPRVIDVIAYTFQCFLSNTWWLEHEQRGELFCVWEGTCRFINTIDVEYNTSPFYLVFWPELLKKNLLFWAKYRKDKIILHDLGQLMEGGTQRYGVGMPVEENTNFILMLHAYWRFTNDRKVLPELREAVKDLTEYLLDSDTDGNGFPNKGCENTIDCGIISTHLGEEQTYLAVKMLCSFHAVLLMEPQLKTGLAPAIRKHLQKLNKTLYTKAWKKDYFTNCLVKRFAEKHLGQGEPEDLSMSYGYKLDNYGDKMAGWDQSSILISNGFLYHFIAGTIPPIQEPEKFRTDLLTSYQQTLTPYGCRFTPSDDMVWQSQNIWRDCAAAYFGVDLLHNAERTWDYIMHVNRLINGCFEDSYFTSIRFGGLNYYPRGVASLLYLFAATGMSFDALKKTVSFAPVQVPSEVPILPLADWKKKQVPRVRLTRTAKGVKMEVKGNTKGFKCTLRKTWY